MTGLRDDVRVATTFESHPKVKRLKRKLGELAVLCLVRLWCWVVRDGRLDGSLAGLTDDDIEIAIDWSGEPGAWVREAVAQSLLDGEAGERAVHNWVKAQPFVASRKERSAKQKESGRLGGQVRAERMSPEERSESARRAARARHAKALRSNPTQDAKGCEGLRTSPTPAPAPAPAGAISRGAQARGGATPPPAGAGPPSLSGGGPCGSREESYRRRHPSEAEIWEEILRVATEHPPEGGPPPVWRIEFARRVAAKAGVLRPDGWPTVDPAAPIAERQRMRRPVGPARADLITEDLYGPQPVPTNRMG